VRRTPSSTECPQDSGGKPRLMSSRTPDAQSGQPGSNPSSSAPPRRSWSRPHSRLRRRLAGMLVLGVSLLAAGGLYVVFAPQPQTARAEADPALVRQGEQLYNNACISCHGTNLQGVQDRGPSLIGVGEAAVYFQVSTGRMPASRQEAQIGAKPVKFSPEEIDALGAFVQANGGGPVGPRGSLGGGDPARGGGVV